MSVLVPYATGLMFVFFIVLLLCGLYGQRTFSRRERRACLVLSILALFTAGVWIVP